MRTQLVTGILQSSIQNALIGALSAADFSVIQASMTPVDFVRDQVLSEPGMPMTHCWFPEQGIVSIIAMCASGRQAEVGLIGFEGMIDIAACLGAHAPGLKAFVQLQGHGHRVRSSSNWNRTGSTERTAGSRVVPACWQVNCSMTRAIPDVSSLSWRGVWRSAANVPTLRRYFALL
jgi:hypothetical protein